MNSTKILHAFVFVVSLLGALALSITVFTAGGNNLGSVFLYIFTPLSFILALTNPKIGFWILVFCGAYLDFVKRLMILERGISYEHISSILAMPPAIVCGISANLFFGMIIKKTKWEPWQTRVFIACFIWMILGTFISGGYASGMRGIGDVVNFVAYPFLLLTIPKLFNSVESIRKAMITIIVIYIPVGLYAIWQSIYGLSDLETDYLLSGFSVVDQVLSERKLRVFSTMGGPSQLGMVAIGLLVIVLAPVSLRGKFGILHLFNPLRLLIAAVFFLAVSSTYVRAAWLTGGASLLIFLVIRYKITSYFFYVAGIIAAFSLYAAAPYLLKNNFMLEWTESSMSVDSKNATDEEMQTKNLTTFNTRLKGMSEIATDSSLWTPFGMAVSKGRAADGMLIHDFVTRTLISVGYIPLTFIILSLIVAAFALLRFNGRLYPSAEVNMFRLFVALSLASLVVMPIGEKNLFTFPTNLMHSIYMSFALGLYIYSIRLPLRSRVPQSLAEPVPTVATGLRRGSNPSPVRGGRTHMG